MNFVWPSSAEWGWIIFVGVTITFAQLFMAKAYSYGRASTIAPLGYLTVIGSYITGVIIFSEIPDILSIVGAAIIVLSGVGVMIFAPAKQRIPGSTPGARV